MRTPPADDIRAGLLVMAALSVAGAALGVLWQWWSPPGPLGLVVSRGAVQPDETEAFVAGDGRFAVIAVTVGLVAGALAWFWRDRRGPALALGLGMGGLGGALLTEAVGHLIRGGSTAGAPGHLIRHLPLSVHASGLLFVEAAAALLVYGMCTAFANSDDLGRPDEWGRARGGPDADQPWQPAVPGADRPAEPAEPAQPGVDQPGVGSAFGYSGPAPSVD